MKKEERYHVNFVQYDRRYHGGMHGVWNEVTGDYVALGPRGKMLKLAALLNEFGVDRCREQEVAA